MLASKRAVLVTGGSGFIGSNVLQRFVEEGRLAVDYDVTPPPPHLSSEVTVVKGDILDLSWLLHVIKQYNVEGIIHTPAVHMSTGSEELPMQTMKINVKGTQNILEAARLANLRRVVFCSTVAVYGKRGLVKVIEDEPPILPFETLYGLTKFTAEQLCFWYYEHLGVDTVVLRLSGVYGPGTRPFKRPFIAGGQAIDWFVHTALENSSIQLEDGGDTQRDYTYIKDVVQGIVLAYEKEKLKYRLYNISNGEFTSVREVARIIQKLLPEVSINIGPGILENLASQDIRRAKSDLNYQPKYNVEIAIKDYIKSLRKEPR